MKPLALYAACLAPPLAVTLYGAVMLPGPSGALVVGLPQLLIYSVIAVNVWFCRASVTGRRVLAGVLFVLALLSCGLLWLLSMASPSAAATGVGMGLVMIGGWILIIQFAIAFLAGYVSCIWGGEG